MYCITILLLLLYYSVITDILIVNQSLLILFIFIIQIVQLVICFVLTFSKSYVIHTNCIFKRVYPVYMYKIK